jgi:hypothetical protein
MYDERQTKHAAHGLVKEETGNIMDTIWMEESPTGPTCISNIVSLELHACSFLICKSLGSCILFHL